MTKLRITPLGTCRIHTPLRRAMARYPIELDLRRNYGFVHTSAEALQLLQFLEGEKSFRPEVAPLVFREADLARFEAEQWEPSDLHVIEISSAKRIASGPDFVQGNYVQRHFSDFFASNQRSRTYWGLVRKGNRQELLAYLKEQPSYRLLPAGDRHLLVNMQMEPQSFKTVKADMAEIVDRLGRDRVVFVTHVNALTPDESPIPVRERLIRWVRLAAEQLDAALFDPTPAMHEFGQARALEDGGLDLTHYTVPFSDRLYDMFHEAHVAARITDPAEGPASDTGNQEAGRLAARLEGMLETGDFFAAAHGVHRATEQFPEAPQLLELRGLIRSRIGDYAGAVEDLTVRGDDSTLSQAMRIALVESLTHIGKFGAALEVTKNLLADEVENARLYRSAAEAAEHSGNHPLAIRFAKQAFRLDGSDLSVGLHALKLLSDRGDPEEAAEWRRELLEKISGSSSGAFEIATWALQNRDDDLFSAALAAGATRDKAGSIDLIEDALEAGMMQATARSIAVAVQLGRLSPALAERRTRLFTKVLETIATLQHSGKAADAFELARSLAQLDAGSGSQVAGAKLAGEAKRLIRQISLHVRDEISAAYQARDSAEIVRIGQGAGNVLLAEPNSATTVARALEDLGRREEALELLKKTLVENPDNFKARRWTGRMAALLGDYETALEAYSGLETLDPKQFAPVRREYERFYATVERRSLKKLHDLAASGKDEALSLAEAITRHLGPLERTERELSRLYRTLRVHLKLIDEGDGDLEDREAILRKMIRIRPDDEPILRKLALELMRQLRFAEAAEVWEKIHRIDPNNESADRNRVRCVTLAKRRASVSNAEQNDVG